MPKKKLYKPRIKINNDETLDTVSAIFNLSTEEMDKLMERFRENIRLVSILKPEFKIAEVFQAGIDAAKNSTQLAYIFFRIGKEHEQQNMAQAARFAEKIIIPGLIGKNGKETLN